MKSTSDIDLSPFRAPPVGGRSDDLAKWIAFARIAVGMSVDLAVRLQEQAAAVRQCEGEILLLRRETDDRGAWIEAELADGASRRVAAARWGVCHTTVGRSIRRRARARARATLAVAR